MSDKRLRSIILSIPVVLFCILLLIAAPVLGDSSNSSLSQTWPSRTPTPGGPSPTRNPPATATRSAATPGATQEPGLTPAVTEEAPPAAETPPVGASPGPGLPTATSGSAVIVGSPAAGESVESPFVELPMAAEIGDCGLPPLALALGPVNVRSGPGIEYETAGSLDYQDARPIIGRAASAPWWLIQLSLDRQGWVSDQAVTVVGYAAGVQVITGAVGEDENQPSWNPTPNPLCTPPARETIDAAAVSVAQLMAVAASATVTPGSPANQRANPETDSDGRAASEPGFSLLPPADGSTGINLIWLPVVGGFLIVAGGIALLIQRRQN